jgi:cytochrome c oxidase subunit 4
MTGTIVSPTTYVLIFGRGALLAPYGNQNAAATLDLGPFNAIVGLTIAVVKSLLVTLFFMHLLYTRHRTIVIAGAGVLSLIILIVQTLSDFLTRSCISMPPPL